MANATIRTLPIRCADGREADAHLMIATGDFHLQVDQIWRPLLVEKREPDAAWLWAQLANELAFPNDVESVVLLHGEMVHGALITSSPSERHKLSQLPELPLYVEYVGIAPWNRADLLDVRIFRGVGPLLLGHAVWRSQKLGRKGCLALHSAFEKSTSFYRYTMKMADRGYDAEAGMRLFEGDAEWVSGFLKGPPQ
jgi:hypothetical protein